MYINIDLQYVFLNVLFLKVNTIIERSKKYLRTIFIQIIEYNFMVMRNYYFDAFIRQTSLMKTGLS